MSRDYSSIFSLIGLRLKKLRMVALIADIHANWPALTVVLDEIKKRGISRIWLLGDALGRGPNPVETYQWTIKTFRGNGCLWVKGNHEDWVMGLDDDRWMQEANPIYIQSDIRQRAEIQGLSGYPGLFGKANTLVEYRGHTDFNFFLTHEGLSNSDGRVAYPWIMNVQEEIFARLAAESPGPKSNIILTGHTHIPALVSREKNTRVIVSEKVIPCQVYPLDVNHDWIINPGSIGYPLDKDPRASFAILDLEKNTYQLIKIPYPIERTVKEIHEKGYPAAIITHLREAPLPSNTPVEWDRHFERVRSIAC